MEKKIGKYKVAQKIQTKGMFLSLDAETKKQVVIKQHAITPKFNKDKCNRVIERLKRLCHKNLFTLIDAFREGDFIYAVYYYYEESLKSYIKRKGLLSLKKAKSLILQLAKGYKELANNKLLHKNIKPSNIMIVNEKTLRLGDYLLVDRTDRTDELYTAPEVTKEGHSCASDIWSIGAVMHYMLKGELPLSNVR
eukprot:TRINITY_DN17277_c0_g1_i1.p1 TRINITY_DN17277_c0_g1~~TRINITY_DN17277_c0_g1_i1.p1  ORF type:complete len:194 (+),score=33.94 TRINITY_DN17277_c0_g1_i1:160-741(+)